MARKTEKGGKFRNVPCRSWNMARKLKIMDNEKYTLLDVKYGEENCKCGKFEKSTVGHGIWQDN